MQDFSQNSYKFYLSHIQAELDLSRATGASEVKEEPASSLKRVHQLTGGQSSDNDLGFWPTNYMQVLLTLYMQKPT